MRLHGASASGSAAAPFNAPAAPTPIAPATMMPRPSNARRSSRPLPATSTIELRSCRDLLMRPPVCERCATPVMRSRLNEETISIPDKTDEEPYHPIEAAAYGPLISRDRDVSVRCLRILRIPHSRDLLPLGSSRRGT